MTELSPKVRAELDAILEAQDTIPDYLRLDEVTAYKIGIDEYADAALEYLRERKVTRSEVEVIVPEDEHAPEMSILRMQFQGCPVVMEFYDSQVAYLHNGTIKFEESRDIDPFGIFDGLQLEGAVDGESFIQFHLGDGGKRPATIVASGFRFRTESLEDEEI